ncbi:DNA-binding NarL/FixJ family response regulator [Microbacterium murale]|uniref:DNA-binding NarL/FixJ family response regulator n=1 Tax=Microbacterium murale TaxID=1081040 RepID=A0ABU0P8N2_9MICO|nr:DNA-binding NarL/FixJ family response regulator [Microbacterium murale]
MSEPIRVVIVDDQELVRAGLRSLAERDGDIAVVDEAPDGRSGLSRVRELRPDVVLMDIRMPVMDGLEATRAIVADAALDGIRVLILTTFDEDENVYAAIRSGASGYLLKDVSPEDLRAAIPHGRRRRFAAVSVGDGDSDAGRRIADGHRPHAARRTHRTRARGVDAGGPRQDQRRDRRRALPQPRHRPHLCQSPARHALRPRPRSARRVGIRDGAGRARTLTGRDRMLSGFAGGCCRAEPSARAGHAQPKYAEQMRVAQETFDAEMTGRAEGRSSAPTR